MAIGHAHNSLAAAAAAALLLVSGCSLQPHRVSNSWPSDVNSTYRALVKTTPPDASSVDRLKAYFQAMQNLVGVTDLEAQYIGCIGCARLSTASPPDELTFIFFREHRADLYAFIAAFERVQSSSLGSPRFTLTFDAAPPPSAACPRPPPQCWPIPSCVSTDACDADRAMPLCQKCPP